MVEPQTSKSSMRQTVAVVVISAAIGLGLVAVAVRLALDIVGYSSLDQETIGTVVSYEQRKESCTSRVTYDVDGTEYETGYGSCPGVGSSVTMRYAADAPEDATGNGPKRTYIGNPLIIAGLLLATGVAWYVGCFRTWTERHQQEAPRRRWRASS